MLDYLYISDQFETQHTYKNINGLFEDFVFHTYIYFPGVQGQWGQVECGDKSVKQQTVGEARPFLSNTLSHMAMS